MRWQTRAAQVSWPLGTVGHGVLQSPQCDWLVLRSTHWPPHNVGASAVQLVEHPNEVPAGAQYGAAG